jgi:pyridoxine kinase
VWPINTVQFSNHTGYGQWRGEVFPAAHLADILDGMTERRALAGTGAVLSGYLGDAAIGQVVLDAVRRVRNQTTDALYCCDPVMGDEGRGLFVRPDIPAFFTEQAILAADIVTPNQFELELLTGGPVSTLAQAIAAARALSTRGPRFVAVTSLRPPAVAPCHLGSLLVSPEGTFLVETPQIDFAVAPNGAGDVFAALLLGRLALGLAAPAALAATVNALFALLARTKALGQRELALVAAQEDLANPPHRFQVHMAVPEG